MSRGGGDLVDLGGGAPMLSFDIGGAKGSSRAFSRVPGSGGAGARSI